MIDFTYAFYSGGFTFSLTSFLTNCWSFYQIHHGFLSRVASCLNFLWDFLIFCLSFYAIYVAKIIKETQYNPSIGCDCKIADGIFFLALIIWVRVSHIILLILYLMFCSPCLCLPDSCLCKPYWMKSSGNNLVKKIRYSGWVMTETEAIQAADSETSQCLICVEAMIAGENLVRLPCLQGVEQPQPFTSYFSDNMEKVPRNSMTSLQDELCNKNSHVFHRDCLADFLKDKSQCPVCMRDLDRRERFDKNQEWNLDGTKIFFETKLANSYRKDE